MYKKPKKILTLLLTTFLISSISVTVYALVQPKSYYDAISWTWSEDGPYSLNYNCLGYATGSYNWEWPWGSSNPTSSQVNSYLSGKGYSSIDYASFSSRPYAYSSAKIASYGSSSSNITHFSRIINNNANTCKAKWGQLEVIAHGSINPYYSSSIYGSAQRIYSK